MPTRLASEAVIQKRPDRLEEVLPGDRLRWVAAGVLEAAKGFRLGKGGKDMPALVAVLRERVRPTGRMSRASQPAPDAWVRGGEGG